MKISLAAALIALTVVLAAGAAQGDAPKILLGYTAVGDCVASFAAKEEGYFAKRGLDVDLQLVNNSAILATDIAAGAMQVGCNVPPVLLQAVNRGVDLVGVAGGSVSSPAQKQTAIVARAGLAIASPRDLYGKNVGVGGIGSNGYIIFGQWLVGRHLDPKRVNFIEVPFSTQYDVLRRGTVDAVVSTEPMLARILSDQTGDVVSYLAAPAGTPLVIYIGARDWTSKNAASLGALRDAIADGAKFAGAHPDRAQQYIAQYLKQPLSVVQATHTSPLQSALTVKQMQWWVDAMKTQGFLTNPIDLGDLIAK
jgi:NitT/TauT family transport system substrate-binding protein